MNALVLVNSAARYLPADDYPMGLSPEVAEAALEFIGSSWGTDDMARVFAPSMADDERSRRTYAKYLRAGCSPRQAVAYSRSMLHLDVRHALPSVRAPTLILQRKDVQWAPSELGQYIADRVEQGRLVYIPGSDAGMFYEALEVIADHVQAFLTGAHRARRGNRMLATVLFTDVVGSTDTAARIGDRRWRELLEAHNERAREHVETFSGRFVGTSGDGVVATFDRPGRALRCALELIEAIEDLGLEIRAGLHAGEVELLESGDVAGIGMHIAARVMAEAGPGEVVVSRTVKDLLAGSDVAFEDRGTHALKGVPERWQLFAARTL